MKQKIEIILRVVIGAVFLFSAYSKLILPGSVEIILIDQGLVSSRETAAIIVRILIGLEFALGILFFLPYMLKKIVIPGSMIFLIGFTAYLSYSAFVLGDSQNCGCFGEMIKMSPVESILKNVVLAGLVVWLFITVKENKRNIIAPLVVVVLSLSVVFILKPVRKAENLKFSEFINFENAGRVDLSSGVKMIAVVNTECDHCRQLVKELVEKKNETNNLLDFYFLIFSEGNISIDSFKVVSGFNFPYHQISMNQFFDLIGNAPPRVYYLEEGKVKEIWDEEILKNIEKSYTSSN